MNICRYITTRGDDNSLTLTHWRTVAAATYLATTGGNDRVFTADRGNRLLNTVTSLAPGLCSSQGT